MSIDLDSTLCQAEVLFLSFSLLVQDIDRRMQGSTNDVTILRNRKQATSISESLPVISENLRELLKRDIINA